MPEAKDLHVDSILSNLSIQYRNEEHIWPFVMPILKVNKRSDKFYKYNKDSSYRIIDDSIGPKGLANELDWGVTDDNYSVVDHAAADYVTAEEVDNADSPIQPNVDTNEILNRELDLAQEDRVASKVFLAATYPTGNKVQLSGTGQWSNAASDPVNDILTAIETCFIRANLLVFGFETWRKLRTHAKVIDAVKSSTRQSRTANTGLATISEIASLFDIPQIVVGRAKKMTSKEGQTDAFDGRVWGKHCVALHVVPNPGVRSVTFGATFSQKQKHTQTMFDVKRGMDGATYIKVGWNSDEKIIASDLGYMIEDAVA